MSIVFTEAPPFNKHTEKYSWPNWNQMAAIGTSNDLRILNFLVKGNFACYMNHLLKFKPDPERVHPWIPSKKR